MLGLKPVAHFIELPPQIFVFDVRVNLSGLDVGMPERRLHGSPASADVQQFGGKRMPHVVEMEIFDACALERRPPSRHEIAELPSGFLAAK